VRWTIRLLVILAVLFQGWQAVRLTRFDRHRAAGIREFGETRWLEAAREFDEARDVSASDSQIWSWLGDAGMSFYEIHRDEPGGFREKEAALDMAWRGYAGAVLRCPVDAWSWSGLAEVATRQVRLRDVENGIDLSRVERRSQGIMDAPYAVAYAAAKTGIFLKPMGYEQLDSLAAIYESTGAVERAEEIYVESARMMPAPAFHYWAGNRLVAPLYEAVLKGLEEGISRSPAFERSMLHREVGKFALAQGDADTAVEQLRAAAKLAAKGYERFYALFDLASALEAAGQLEAAIDSLRQARDEGFPRGAIGRRIGGIALRLERPAEACPELRESLREEPKDDGLRVQTALACEKAGEIDLAERALRENFVLPTDNLALARALVDFYRRIGRTSTADNLVRTWARDNPDNKVLERWAGEAAGR
jgi:tetratricopeptide (TPR) repeat protein